MHRNKIKMQISCKDCVFCQKLRQKRTSSFCELLKKALFCKYSSSQNYFYTKELNAILEDETTKSTIKIKDIQTQVEQEEYLKRFYPKRDLKSKQLTLLDYYRYHIDIPRIFMDRIYKIIYRFHEKKRRIKYAKIKQKLGIKDENSSHNKNSKSSQNQASVPLELRNFLRNNMHKIQNDSFQQQQKSTLILKQFLNEIGNGEKTNNDNMNLSQSMQSNFTVLSKPIEDVTVVLKQSIQQRIQKNEKQAPLQSKLNLQQSNPKNLKLRVDLIKTNSNFHLKSRFGSMGNINLPSQNQQTQSTIKIQRSISRGNMIQSQVPSLKRLYEQRLQQQQQLTQKQQQQSQTSRSSKASPVKINKVYVNGSRKQQNFQDMIIEHKFNSCQSSRGQSPQRSRRIFNCNVSNKSPLIAKKR